MDATVERLRAAGAPIVAEPEDQPWGERVARTRTRTGTWSTSRSRWAMGEPRARHYDDHPERFRLARAVQRDHGAAAVVHGRVAQRLLAESATPVLDVGCGDGELARHLPGGAWVGVDSSKAMLAAAPEPHVRADATDLPFDRPPGRTRRSRGCRPGGGDPAG